MHAIVHVCLSFYSGGFLYVNIFDPSNGKYVYRFGNTEIIEADKSTPDASARFKMYVLANNELAFQADNGRYLSRVLISGSSPTSIYNYIRADKTSTVTFARFAYDFRFSTPPASRPKSIGQIALRSDNGRYWERSREGAFYYIKPLSQTPVYFELIIAE